MKADYEPWWMFDGWEESVLTRQCFTDINEANQCLHDLLSEFREKYCHEKMQKNCYAFWSEEEKLYCEGCDDDLQIFHGVFLLREGKICI